MSKRETGIYFGLSNGNYHSDKSISASGLNTLENGNPKIYWYGSPFNVDRVVEESPALKYGQFFHEYILEDTFDVDTMVKKGCKTTTKQGMIGEGDFSKFEKIRSRLKADKVGSKLLGIVAPENVAIEVSCFWDEPLLDSDGSVIGTVPARCRWDVLTMQGIVADLKSIDKADLSDRVLRNHILKYGYQRQCYWYLQGLRAMRSLYKKGDLKIFGCYNEQWLDAVMTSEKELSVLVFASKKPPNICRSVEIVSDDLAVAGLEVATSVEQFHSHLKKYGGAEWPSGYEDKVDELKLSNYY